MTQKLSQAGNLLLKLVVLFVFGWPFFWLISTSLQTIYEVNSVTPTFFPAVPQFKNYLDAWHSGPLGMGIYLKNSILVILGVISLQIIIMLPAAYAFAKYSFPLKNVMFGCVLISLMMPTQITFLPIYLMMSDMNLIQTLWPQILPFCANAFGVFMLRQYFMQVPDELLEAARLDGAKEARVILSIMLPMSKPAIATVVLFSFVNHWNEYFWPLVMTSADIVRTLPLGIAQLKEVEGLSNFNVVMAGNAILVAPILLIYAFASRQLMKSFAYSGIK